MQLYIDSTLLSDELWVSNGSDIFKLYSDQLTDLYTKLLGDEGEASTAAEIRVIHEKAVERGDEMRALLKKEEHIASVAREKDLKKEDEKIRGPNGSNVIENY